MTIQLNPEEERLIGQAIQAGLIGKADDVVAVGVETIRRQLQSQVGSGSELNTEQWMREFRAWVHGHTTTTPRRRITLWMKSGAFARNRPPSAPLT